MSQLQDPNGNQHPLISSIFGSGSVYQSLDRRPGIQSVQDDHFQPVQMHPDLPGDEESRIGELPADTGVRESPGVADTLGSDKDSESEEEAPLTGQIALPASPPQHVDWPHPRENDDEDESNGGQNLLVEGYNHAISPRKPFKRNSFTGGISIGLNRLNLRNRQGTSNPVTNKGRPKGKQPSMLDLIDPKERALWKWSNVENLDIFLQEIYAYFLGNGIYCIILARIVNMATILFVVGFSTYLSSCIDYSKIRGSNRLEDVQIRQCMAHVSGFHRFLLWVTALFWFMKLFQYVRDVRRLQDLRDFFWYLLEISDADMQTISWQQVVSRLEKLRTWNMAAAHGHGDTMRVSKRLDAHDVANRIMRKENYMIALINRDTLDLSIPLPYLRNSKHFYTRTLEWNIGLCVMDFVFNSEGQLRPIFLKEQHRKVLSEGLRRRFIFTGIMNILCAPFIIAYMTLLYFFLYFNEYHKDPAAIGTRQYSPYGEWKMREYNELYHLFQRRLNMSYLPASRYVNQFPKEMTVILFRFIAFVAGSFAAVLGIISLVDPELFLGFEVTKDKTVLFYIGIFGTILAVSRGMIPSETLVFDPEASMRYVVEFTHYLPPDWEGKLHSDYVKGEFSKLYQLRIVLLLKELVSVVIAPFIMWFSLPESCDRIVDFFRENSVHIDGLGYVCSSAVFNFEKNGPKQGHTGMRTTSNFESGDGKMMKSYFNFLDNYAEGTPQERQYHQLHHQNRGHEREPVDNELEFSVMGRYNKWQQQQGRGFRGGTSYHPGLAASHQPGLATSYQHQPRAALDSRYAMPLVERGEDDGTFESALREEPEEDPAMFAGGIVDNGGVLGLLNQFYKHSNSAGGN